MLVKMKDRIHTVNGLFRDGFGSPYFGVAFGTKSNVLIPSILTREAKVMRKRHPPVDARWQKGSIGTIRFLLSNN